MPRAEPPPTALAEEVPLSSLTTLGVGGPARYLASCGSNTQLRQVLAWARGQGLAACMLGGGSNLLVADEGFRGLAIRLTDTTIKSETRGDRVLVHAAAGVGWDALVAWTVEEELAGIECLSGIPGRVGAAPIQNVGAYGQEVSETIDAVYGIDRRNGRTRCLATGQCGFSYRSSHFKARWPGRYAITQVDFLLRRGAPGTCRYPELRRQLGLRKGGAKPSVSEVRDAVLRIRRAKSMVLEPGDPNWRSAGSFFVNPVVPPDRAGKISQRRGESGRPMPSFPASGGGVKLSAAWLIEEAGFPRGYGSGRVGLSTRHSLALVNRGGATARELIGLATKIRRGVREAFGVTLEPEPTFLGFTAPVEELLG